MGSAGCWDTLGGKLFLLVKHVRGHHKIWCTLIRTERRGNIFVYTVTKKAW